MRKRGLNKYPPSSWEARRTRIISRCRELWIWHVQIRHWMRSNIEDEAAHCERFPLYLSSRRFGYLPTLMGKICIHILLLGVVIKSWRVFDHPFPKKNDGVSYDEQTPDCLIHRYLYSAWAGGRDFPCMQRHNRNTGQRLWSSFQRSGQVAAIINGRHGTCPLLLCMYVCVITWSDCGVITVQYGTDN